MEKHWNLFIFGLLIFSAIFILAVVYFIEGTITLENLKGALIAVCFLMVLFSIVIHPN